MGQHQPRTMSLSPCCWGHEWVWISAPSLHCWPGCHSGNIFCIPGRWQGHYHELKLTTINRRQGESLDTCSHQWSCLILGRWVGKQRWPELSPCLASKSLSESKNQSEVNNASFFLSKLHIRKRTENYKTKSTSLASTEQHLRMLPVMWSGVEETVFKELS